MDNEQQREGKVRYEKLSANDKALVDVRIERNLVREEKGGGINDGGMGIGELAVANTRTFINNQRAYFTEPEKLQRLRDEELSAHDKAEIATVEIAEAQKSRNVYESRMEKAIGEAKAALGLPSQEKGLEIGEAPNDLKDIGALLPPSPKGAGRGR